MPRLSMTDVAPELYQAFTKPEAALRKGPLDPALRELVKIRASQLNGCLFCQDWRTERDGVKVEAGFETAVEEWRTTTAFDDRTRLAAGRLLPAHRWRRTAGVGLGKTRGVSQPSPSTGGL